MFKEANRRLHRKRITVQYPFNSAFASSREGKIIVPGMKFGTGVLPFGLPRRINVASLKRLVNSPLQPGNLRCILIHQLFQIRRIHLANVPNQSARANASCFLATAATFNMKRRASLGVTGGVRPMFSPAQPALY